VRGFVATSPTSESTVARAAALARDVGWRFHAATARDPEVHSHAESPVQIGRTSSATVLLAAGSVHGRARAHPTAARNSVIRATAIAACIYAAATARIGAADAARLPTISIVRIIR